MSDRDLNGLISLYGMIGFWVVLWGSVERDYDFGFALVRGLLWPVILVRAVVVEFIRVLYRG